MSKLRLATSAVIAICISLTTAQGQDATKHHRHKKPAQPAAETAGAEAPDPVAMQKWFGGAVDDILTNTSRSLNGLPGGGR